MGDFTWNEAIRLIEILVWPLVTLIGIVILFPQLKELVAAFKHNGGKFSALGIDAELNAKRLERATESIEEDEGDSAEDSAELSRVKTRLHEMPNTELYYEVTTAWTAVSDAISAAYESKTGGYQLDWRSGHWSISEAKKNGLLTEKQANAVDDLFAVRSSTKRRGPNGFEDMQMDADDVFDYVRSTQLLAKQILDANGVR